MVADNIAITPFHCYDYPFAVMVSIFGPTVRTAIDQLLFSVKAHGSKEVAQIVGVQSDLSAPWVA